MRSAVCGSGSLSSWLLQDWCSAVREDMPLCCLFCGLGGRYTGARACNSRSVSTFGAGQCIRQWRQRARQLVWPLQALFRVVALRFCCPAAILSCLATDAWPLLPAPLLVVLAPCVFYSAVAGWAVGFSSASGFAASGSFCGAAPAVHIYLVLARLLLSLCGWLDTSCLQFGVLWVW